MAARSIASLTVSFGLVSIPVKLFSATEASRAISFNLLHKTCGSRLKQQYFCIKEEVPVAREDMVKGYEFAKDQYVTFTPEELKAMEEAGTQMAEITEFVPIEAIDPVYFDKAYYLAPDKGGAKPFALLASALRESKRCALGRWAARGKQYIVMIRPVTDQVAARIEAAVQRKVEGQEITMTEAPEGGGAQVIDLMEALRASLEKKPAKGKQTLSPALSQGRGSDEARKPPKRAQVAEAPAPVARKGAKNKV